MSIALLKGKENPNKEKAYDTFGAKEEAAVSAVMKGHQLSGFLGRSGDMFLGGTKVRAFEKQIQDYFHVAHAVSFNSASTALQAAVAALGIGPGDEVITSPFTMSATASAILLNNALPIFADIDPQTYCIDPVSIEKRITPRTKAILAVNLFGSSADYEKIQEIAKRHHIKIIEDNAQAVGARYNGAYTGTIGDIGVFSLNFHKIIHCGEGGVLATNNERCAFRAQLVRNHGEMVVDDLSQEGVFEPLIGSNYRLGELHAAIAIEQLKKLEQLLSLRRKTAQYLTKRLKEFSWIIPYELPEQNESVYYLYPFQVLTPKIGILRDTVAKALISEGFPVGQGYQKPLYLLPAYQKKRIFENSQYPFVSADYSNGVEYAKGLCPVAERMYEHDLLTTTIFQPPNTEIEIDEFVAVLKSIEEHREELLEYERKTKA